jgi:hypothetical protein
MSATIHHLSAQYFGIISYAMLLQDIMIRLQSLGVEPVLEMTNKIRVEEAGAFLGNSNSVKFKKNDVWFGAHASFQYGDIWVEQVADSKAAGYKMHLLICKPEFKTQRGIKIGDTEKDVLDTYGKQPIIFDVNLNSDGSNLNKVVKWIEYIMDNYNKRIFFGINKACAVSYIGFSQTGGGI